MIRSSQDRSPGPGENLGFLRARSLLGAVRGDSRHLPLHLLPMRLGRLAILLTGLLAIACQPAAEPTESTPGSTVPITTTVTTQAITIVVETDPNIVFDEVDTGVANKIKLLDLDLATMHFAELDPAGDTLDLVGCRTTWFGNYEFEFEWAPAPSSNQTSSTRQVVVVFGIGDTGSNGVYFEAELASPGRFVVPVTGFDALSGPDEIRADTQIIDRVVSVTCIPNPLGDPVTESAGSATPLTLELTAPLQLHSADSLQGVIEGMDPTDQHNPLRPLGALAGVTPEFPVDVVYVLADQMMTTVIFETDGACHEMTSIYDDEAQVLQHAGCFDGRHGGNAIDDDWTVEIAGGFTVEELQPLHWVGHPGMEIPRTAEEYLDQRELPEGSTEVFRTEVSGILVSVIRYQSDDGGTVSYQLRGLGDNSGGGGFPGEAWAGCYQVEWRETGYSMVVVGDSDWKIEVQGEPIELTEADGVGIAVVPVPIRQRDQIRIETESGEIPPCLES